MDSNTSHFLRKRQAKKTKETEGGKEERREGGKVAVGQEEMDEGNKACTCSGASPGEGDQAPTAQEGPQRQCGALFCLLQGFFQDNCE